MAVKRLLVSLDQKLFEEIGTLAKFNNQSMSEVARGLMNNSLELLEDQVLTQLAEKRLEHTQEWISHEDTWQ